MKIVGIGSMPLMLANCCSLKSTSVGVEERIGKMQEG